MSRRLMQQLDALAESIKAIEKLMEALDAFIPEPTRIRLPSIAFAAAATDDSVAVQSAIYASTNFGASGDVFFPPGRYRILLDLVRAGAAAGSGSGCASNGIGTVMAARGEPRGWWIFGAAIGVGFLAKITVVLVLAVAWYLLTHGLRRLAGRTDLVDAEEHRPAGAEAGRRAGRALAAPPAGRAGQARAVLDLHDVAARASLRPTRQPDHPR